MARVEEWGTAGVVAGVPGSRRSPRTAEGFGDGADGAPSVRVDGRAVDPVDPVDLVDPVDPADPDREDPRGLDRPAYARTEAERAQLARRVLGAATAPGVLVVVQNSVVRDRGRPPARSGLRVVAGGSHARHPGLYLGFVADGRCGFLDRELHLPRSVFSSLPMRTVAGLPDGMPYSAPAQLVMRMLTRALDAGARASWLVVGPGLARHWPLRTLAALRGLGLLAELTADEAAAELAGGTPEAIGGQVVDGHVWVVARRPSSSGSGTYLVLRHRLADPSDRTVMLSFGPVPPDLPTVLHLADARQQAAAAFARLRRYATLDLQPPAAEPADPAAPTGTTGPIGPAGPPDPWTAWYQRVTRAMVAQADEAFPEAVRSGAAADS